MTHDQVEAKTLGQRVAVMRDGRVQQVASPHELYTRPANLFVAAFIGSPAMNLAHAEIDGDHVEFAGFRIPLDRGRRPAAAAAGRLVVGLRPEAFQDAAVADASWPQVDVTPAVLEVLGSDVHLIFPVDGAPVLVDDVLQASDDEDAALLGDGALFNARVDERSTAAAGVPMRLAVDPARLHFFDAATGASLAPETARAEAAAPAR